MTNATKSVEKPLDYFDDVPTAPVEVATLELLARLAHESSALEAEILRDSVALEEKNAALSKLMRVRIPEIMGTLGMEEFKLTDGSVVSVKADIKCGITEVNKPAAFAWLEKEHFDGIIKTNVAAQFGKGEMEKAKEALELLEKAGFSGSMDRSIHSATLKSFVKERLENGDNIPVDTFGIFEFKMAKIKLPKPKK
jgi:hypothetical protein